jgi:hypothetical protein
MPRNPKQPPEGGSVREPIKQMTGFSSEAEMAEALPDNTMVQANEEAPRPRKARRTKEEMATYRASMGIGTSEPLDDPLMNDPRYKKAVEKMRSAGLSTTVKTGFETVGVITKDKEDIWPLKDDEFRDVDDFSYVVSKKFPVLDPTGHWWAMAIYFLALLGTLTFKRLAKSKSSNMMKWLTDLFTGPEEELDAQELENEKQASV